MEKSSSYKILIVDDNSSNLFSLRTLIKQYIDADVIEADSGDKALKELLKHSVDLMILDIQMDEMDGFELASIIKQRKRTKDIPIVFLTASFISDEFKKRGFKIGAVDYLTKPIDEYQLINRIKVYLKLIEKERNMNLLLEKKVREQTEELRKAKEEAEAANEAKSMFLANVSHELRTPLNVLLSTTQLINIYLQNDDIPKKEKYKKKINVQMQNCYRLQRLINNLLDITAIDTGHYILNKTQCNIVRLVEAMTSAVREYVEDKGIIVRFDSDIQNRVIVCDTSALERIIFNLLSNAVKVIPQGGVIEVNIRDAHNAVQISVKNNGPEIGKDHLDVIFERFMQTDHLYIRNHEGAGIGLSLVKSLVEMHGGQVYVDSSHHSGTEFIVELPGHLVSQENGCKYLEYKLTEDISKKVQIELSDIYF